LTPTPRLPVAAFGFDLGETLYHYRSVPLRWVEDVRPLVERTLDALGADRTRDDVATAHEGAGDVATASLDRLTGVTASSVLTDVLSRLGPRRSARVETVLETAVGRLRRDIVAYPDAVATLAALKQAGFAVGALTNVPFGTPRRLVRRDLERTGLAPFFDALVTSVDVGLRKPHRATFAWLAAMLGVEPREIAYVGNLPTDVSGARASGCVPVFLDRRHSRADHGQTVTVAGLSELPDLFVRSDEAAGPPLG